MKTVLVVGASGFVGSNVVLHLRKKHKVVAAFHRNVIHYDGVTPCIYKLPERDYMKRLMTLIRPSTIIYCAGITDFIECAKNQRAADAVNSMGPVAFSSAADMIPHRLIYLSSAYVYDGKKGNFSEADTLFPENAFGKGKLAGENYVRSKTTEYTMFRLSPLFGIGSIYHQSIFDQIRMKLEKGIRVELSDSEYHSFLSIDTALKAIEWAMTFETENAVYNLGGLTKLSWFDFGVTVAEKLGFDKSLIIPGKGNFETSVDFSLNGSELIKKSEINPLVLEESLDLFKEHLVA